MMQPVVKDERGVLRFKGNAIVQALLRESTLLGFGLNRLSEGEDFTQADWEQFYQLIGYTLAGYHELSMISDDSALQASKAAQEAFGPKVRSGCRDTGCEIHCGVARKGER